MNASSDDSLKEPIRDLTAVPWDLKEALLVVGLFLFFLLFFWLAVQIGFFLLTMVGAAWWGRSLLFTFKSTELISTFVLIFLALFEVIFLVGATWYFAIKKHAGNWHELGLGQFRPFPAIGLVLLSLPLILIFGGFYSFLLDRLGKISVPEIDLVEAFGGGVAGLILAIVLGSIVTPFAEELFFRGFLYPAFKKRFGFGWALIISSFIFAISHLSLWLVLPMVFIGLIAVLLYEKTSSLYPPVLLHILNNLLAVLFFYLKL